MIWEANWWFVTLAQGLSRIHVQQTGWLDNNGMGCFGFLLIPTNTLKQKLAFLSNSDDISCHWEGSLPHLTITSKLKIIHNSLILKCKHSAYGLDPDSTKLLCRTTLRNMLLVNKLQNVQLPWVCIHIQTGDLKQKGQWGPRLPSQRNTMGSPVAITKSWTKEGPRFQVFTHLCGWTAKLRFFCAKQANELNNLLNTFIELGPNPLKPCTTLVNDQRLKDTQRSMSPSSQNWSAENSD